MSIDPRIPEPVQPIIKNYVVLTQKRLAGLINAFYIVGSIALGEFNEQFSDIDFITVLNCRVTSLETDHLRNIHQTIDKTHPRWRMSGSYILSSDLGKPGNDIALRLHFHHGILHPFAQNSLNSISWWELKNHGIAIVGSDPRKLPFTVNWDLLLKEMRQNLNSYWLSWTHHPPRLILMYSDWGIQWAVLGVLRHFYTFRENSITAKVRAANYALDHLPLQWHPLVPEAVSIRQCKKSSSYRLKFGRMVEAVHLLKYIINRCNAYFVQ